VSGLVVYFRGENLNFLAKFTTNDYLILGFCTFSSAYSGIFFIKAVMLSSPGKLSLYRYIGPVLQFILDIAIFNTNFISIQLFGIAVVFITNGIIIIRTYRMA
jgi:drug/metabolite transporter (DMT)-like permease